MNFVSLKLLGSQEMVRDMLKIEKTSNLCVDDINSKQPRSVFSHASTYKASKVLELIQVDICGQLEP